MNRRWLISAFAALSILIAPLLTAGPAAADVFGPIGLVSQGSLGGGSGAVEQGVYAHDPAISGNGEYIAFDGYFAGRTGVWRRDVATGVTEPVAVGSGNEFGESCTEGSACDAVLPSISENGQYVSFTTSAKLASADTNRGPDVYVRDMDVGVASEDAYKLASPLSYEYSSSGNVAEEERYGSIASGRSALSANGQEVVFVTTAVSNLDGSATPAMQVALHNFESGSTELISSRYPNRGQPEPVSSIEGSTTLGAVYSPSTSGPPAFPFGRRAYGSPPAVGASISADGTTVAWMGYNVPEQAPMLAGETNVLATYVEPLWRRIADGAATETRRVTGGSDPLAPACIASGETTLEGNLSLSNPCQGPFLAEPEAGVYPGNTYADAVPKLSADGNRVAFLTSAPALARGADFEKGVADHSNADLYVVNMEEGLARTQALRPLTELASGKEENAQTNATILDFAISADGNQVAFTTKRTEFPLGTPTYVSANAGVAGLAELFDADLADNTLTRVTNGFEGGPAGHPHPPVAVSGEAEYKIASDGALSPSFSATGNALAFSSTASNLVYGDGNTPRAEGQALDGSDAFVVDREVFPPLATETSVSPAPPGPAVVASWRLGVTARSRANGSYELFLEVPSAGTARASATGAVRVRVRAKARNKRSAGTRVVTRTLASALSHPKAGGLTGLVLTLKKAYRQLASRHDGLSAIVEVEFSAPGHPLLRQSLAVTFLRKIPVRRAGQHAKARR